MMILSPSKSHIGTDNLGGMDIGWSRRTIQQRIHTGLACDGASDGAN